MLLKEFKKCLKSAKHVYIEVKSPITGFDGITTFLTTKKDVWGYISEMSDSYPVPHTTGLTWYREQTEVEAKYYADSKLLYISGHGGEVVGIL